MLSEKEERKLDRWQLNIKAVNVNSAVISVAQKRWNFIILTLQSRTSAYHKKGILEVGKKYKKS